MLKNKHLHTLPKNIFITGTDTEVGKTYTTEQLLKYFNKQGYKTLGLKPIASDAKHMNEKLVNSDALTLQQAANIKLDYDLINPYCFEPPIAPHIAAKQAKIKLDITKIQQSIKQAISNIDYDICFIEGAGGWHVPLNDQQLFSDFAYESNLPVILVVGIKLGCINHALLTAQAIKQSGCQLIGWIANCLNTETAYIKENIQIIQSQLSPPLLSIVNYSGTINSLKLNPSSDH
jgi:dethiobiotin synthetase